jgi:membrane protease YdiL (CAAX protease family)
MSGDGGDDESRSVVDRLPLLVRGRDDTRLRAGWRVLVAAVVFLPLSTGVGAAVVATVAPLVGVGPSLGMVLTSVVAACVLAALLVPWARYVDRRPLGDYGFSRSPAWGVDLLAGFGAVSLAYGLWFALASALGGGDVEVSLAGPEGALLLWLVAGLLTNLFSALAQDTVFFGVIIQNAAEGIRGWDVTPARAVVGGWLVGIVFFVLIHGAKLDPVVLLNWVVGAGVFGLLYVHTGELALPIGAHAANNFLSNAVEVTGTVPVPGVVSDWAYPRVAVAYLVLLAWLYWRRGEVSIQERIAEWPGR